MATRTWLVNDYPGIAAALPQSLIDYANLFGPAVDEIAPLLARKPLSSGDRAQLVALFTALQSEARRDQSARVGTRCAPRSTSSPSWPPPRPRSSPASRAR